MCKCPQCWVLQADGKTCGPDPALINVQCAHSGMSVEIDQCVFGVNVVQIGFDQSDSSCQSQNIETNPSSDNYQLFTDLDGCGTTNQMTDANTVGFFNALEVTILNYISLNSSSRFLIK